MKKNIFKAIYQKDINLIKKIIDEEYDINFSNSLGETAIFKAVISNDSNIVEIILNQNPRLDMIYENGCKIVHIACQIANISPKIIELLLEKIENINEQDVMGNISFDKTFSKFR